MKFNPSSILVIRMSGIGDVVWTTPLLANLKLAYPEAHIGYVVRKSSAMVLENNPHVDTIHIFEREDLAFQGRFLRQLARQRYDLSIDVICSPATAIQSVACGAKDRIGFDFRVRRMMYNHVISRKQANLGHEVEFNLAVLDYMEIPRTVTELVWFVSEEERAYAQKLNEDLGIADGAPIVGLMPTGGYESKKWPAEYYAEAARLIAAKKRCHVIVLWGSPKEEQEAVAIARAAGPGVQALPKQNLRETAATLERCALVIGNDTGPLHIAPAVGARVIGLYGPGNEFAQGPWGAKTTVLRAPGGREICCGNIVCTTPGHPCMRELTPEMVAEEALASL